MVYGNTNNDSYDYLKGCTPSNCIPRDASLNESIYFVAEANEKAFNELIMNIGLDELATLEETGSEVLYEDGSAKKEGLFTRAKAFFESMWKNLQDLIQTAIRKFNEKSDDFRKNIISKLDDKVLSAKLANVKNDASFGTTYAYEKLDNLTTDLCKKVEKGGERLTKLYSNAASSAKAGSDEVLNKLDTDMENCVKNVIDAVSQKGSGRVLNANTFSASAIVPAIKDYARGAITERNGYWVKANWKTVLEEVTKYPKTKRTLKADYNSAKKTFNDAIKKCKAANDGKMFEANAYTKAIKYYKELLQITTSCEQAVISLLNEQYSFYRGVIIKVVGTKKSVKESVEESTTMDRIDSLFAW